MPPSPSKRRPSRAGAGPRQGAVGGGLNTDAMPDGSGASGLLFRRPGSDGGLAGVDGDIQYLESLQLMDTALQALPGRTLREYFAPVVGLKKNMIIRKHRTEIHMGALLLAIAIAKKKAAAADRGEAEVEEVDDKSTGKKAPTTTTGTGGGGAAAQASSKEAGEQQLTEALRRLAKSVMDAGAELHPTSGGPMPLDVDMFVDALRPKCEAISYEGGEVLCYPHEPPETMFVYIILRGEATITHFQPQLQRVTITGENRPSFFTSGKETVLLSGSGVLLDATKGTIGSGGLSARSDGMSVASGVETVAGGGDGQAGGGGAAPSMTNDGAITAASHHGGHSNLLKNLRAAMRYVGQPTLEVVRTETIRGPCVIGASEALSMAPFSSASVVGSGRNGGPNPNAAMSTTSRLQGEHLDVIRIRMQEVHEVLISCALLLPTPALVAVPSSTAPEGGGGGASIPLPTNTTTTTTTGKATEKRGDTKALDPTTVRTAGRAAGEKKTVQVMSPPTGKKERGKSPAPKDPRANRSTTEESGLGPSSPTKPLPTVADFIQHARSHTLSLYYPQNEILLRQSWLLQDTQPQTIRHLIAHMTPRTYLPGDILACPHGSSTRELCFLRRGEVCIVEPPPKIEEWGAVGAAAFQGGIEPAHLSRGHRRYERGSSGSDTSSRGGGSGEDDDGERIGGGRRGSRGGYARSYSSEGRSPPSMRDGLGRGTGRHRYSRRSPCTCDRRSFGAVVDVIHPGSSFGELSVLFGEPRAYTLVASTVCDVWCLTYRDFSLAMQRDDALRDTLVQKAAALRVKWLAEQRFTPQLTKHLRESCEMFRPFPDIVLRLIQERIEPVVYSPGELITSVADRCREMIFIMQGRVESLVKGLARYSAGHVLGASCLVGHRWPLALSAKTMVEGWRLSREQLLDALHRADILRAHSGEHTTLRTQYMWQIFRPPFPEFTNESAEDRNQMPIVPPAPGGTSYPEYGVRVSDILLRALCVVFKGYVKWEDISYGSAAGGQAYNQERLARRHVIEQLQQLVQNSAMGNTGYGTGGTSGVEGGAGGSLGRRSPSKSQVGRGSTAGPSLHTALQQQSQAQPSGAGGRSISVASLPRRSTSAKQRSIGHRKRGGIHSGIVRGLHSTSTKSRVKREEEKKDRLRRKVLGEDTKDAAGEGMTVIKHHYKRRKQTTGNCPFLVDDDAAERPFHSAIERRPPLNTVILKKNPSQFDKDYVEKMKHKPLLDSCFSVQDPGCTSRLRRLMYVPPKLAKLESFLQERDEICMYQNRGPSASPGSRGGSSRYPGTSTHKGGGGGAESEYLSQAGGKGGLDAMTTTASIVGTVRGRGHGRAASATTSFGGAITMGGGDGASVFGATGRPSAGHPTGNGVLVPSFAARQAGLLGEGSFGYGYYPSSRTGSKLPAIPPVHVFLQSEKPRVELSLQEAISVGLVLRLPSINGIESCVPVVDPDVCIGLPSHRSRRYQMAITPNDRHHKHCFQFAAAELEEEKKEQGKKRHGKGGSTGVGGRFGTEGDGSGNMGSGRSCISTDGAKRRSSSVPGRGPPGSASRGRGRRGEEEGVGWSARGGSTSVGKATPLPALGGGRRGEGGGGGEDEEEEGSEGEGSVEGAQHRQFLTETLFSMWRANLTHYQTEAAGRTSKGARGHKSLRRSEGGVIGGGRSFTPTRPRSHTRSTTQEPSSMARAIENYPVGMASNPSPPPSSAGTEQPRGDTGREGGGGFTSRSTSGGADDRGSGRGDSLQMASRKISPSRATTNAYESEEGGSWAPSPSRDMSTSRPRPPGMISLVSPHRPTSGPSKYTPAGGSATGMHEMLCTSNQDRYAAAHQTLLMLQRTPQRALELLLMRFGGATGIICGGGGGVAAANRFNSFQAFGGGGGGAFSNISFPVASSPAPWMKGPMGMGGEGHGVPFSFPREEPGMRSTSSGSRGSSSTPGSPFRRKGLSRNGERMKRGGKGGRGGGGDGRTMVDRLKGLSGWPTLPPPVEEGTSSLTRTHSKVDRLLPGVVVEVGDTDDPHEMFGIPSPGSLPMAPHTGGPTGEKPDEWVPNSVRPTSQLAVIPPLGIWKDRGNEMADERREGEGEDLQKVMRNKWRKAITAKELHGTRKAGGGPSTTSFALSSSHHRRSGEEEKGLGGDGAAHAPWATGNVPTRPSARILEVMEDEDDDPSREVEVHLVQNGHPPLEFLHLDNDGVLQLSYTDEYTMGSAGASGGVGSNLCVPPTPRSPGISRLLSSAVLPNAAQEQGGIVASLPPRSSIAATPHRAQKGRPVIPRGSFALANAALAGGGRRHSAVGFSVMGAGGVPLSPNSGAAAATVPPLDRFFMDKRRFLYVDGFGVLNVPEDYQGGPVVCFGGGAIAAATAVFRGASSAPTTPHHGTGVELSVSGLAGSAPGDALGGTMMGKGAGYPISSLSTPVHVGHRAGRRSGSLLQLEGNRVVESGAAPPGWEEDAVPEKFVLPSVEEAEECMERMQRDVDGLNAVAAAQSRERERLRFLQISRGGAHKYEEVQKILSVPTMEEAELMDVWKQDHESVLRDHMRLAQIPHALVKHAGVNYLDEAIREINQYVPPAEAPSHKTVLAWYDQLETHTVWDELGHVNKIANQNISFSSMTFVGGSAGASGMSSPPSFSIHATPLAPAIRGGMKKQSFGSRDESSLRAGIVMGSAIGGESELLGAEQDFTGPGWEKTSDSKRVLASIGTRQIARGAAVCAVRSKISTSDRKDPGSSMQEAASSSFFPTARPLRTPARDMTPQAYEEWVKEREGFLERYMKMTEK